MSHCSGKCQGSSHTILLVGNHQVIVSVFRHNSYANGGCRHVAYTCIAGAGNSGSILHYGHAEAPNDQDVKDGDIVLFDMGAEYYCYCSGRLQF